MTLTMYACMYLCVYVCMHASMHACMYVYVYACMCVCMHVPKPLLKSCSKCEVQHFYFPTELKTMSDSAGTVGDLGLGLLVHASYDSRNCSCVYIQGILTIIPFGPPLFATSLHPAPSASGTWKNDCKTARFGDPNTTGVMQPFVSSPGLIYKRGGRYFG